MSNIYNDPNRKGGGIQTYTGEVFYPLDPREEEIKLFDVAHALANKCRFTGHTVKHYSVGEHSLRVSLFLELIGQPLMVQYVGLHHDDAEAYLPDVPTPLKRLPEFAWFKEIEEHLQAVCFKRFGCIVEDYSIIKRVDRMMAITEKRDVMPKRNNNWDDPEYPENPIPDPYKIEPMKFSYVKKEWIKRHLQLALKLELTQKNQLVSM